MLADSEDARVAVRLVGARSEDTAVVSLVDGGGGQLVLCGVRDLGFRPADRIDDVEIEVAGEVREVGCVRGVAHDDLSVRKGSRASVRARIAGARVTGRARVDDAERMEEEM